MDTKRFFVAECDCYATKLKRQSSGSLHCKLVLFICFFVVLQTGATNTSSSQPPASPSQTGEEHEAPFSTKCS